MAKEKKAPKATKAPKERKAPKGLKSRGKRKLTNEQVLAIVKRKAAGEKPAHLAREYGVSHPTVSAILGGRTYVWLTGIGMPVEAQEQDRSSIETAKELEAA